MEVPGQMNDHLTGELLDPAAYSPVTPAFASMAPRELNSFYEGFMLNKPYCLDDLIHAVWQTPGCEHWSADFSAQSLDALGEWFASRIHETARLLHSAEASSDAAVRDIANEEKAFVVAVGMYYGDVAVRNNPSLGWHQLKGNKKQADYGQPVVCDSGTLPTNPVRVAHVFASGIADGSKTPGQLRQTYDYWMQLIQ